jgi:hypothetical protein
MSASDQAPDLSRLTPDELAKILVERGALEHARQGGQATAATDALGGLFGLGFDTEPRPDVQDEPCRGAGARLRATMLVESAEAAVWTLSSNWGSARNLTAGETPCRRTSRFAR